MTETTPIDYADAIAGELERWTAELGPRHPCRGGSPDGEAPRPEGGSGRGARAGVDPPAEGAAAVSKVAKQKVLADLLGSTSDLLDHLAEGTGDARYRHASGILRGKPAGRPAIDDDAALRLADNLLATGSVTSRRAACLTAAKFYASSHQVEAMRDRLQRKLRQK